MADLGLKVFDKTVHETNMWLQEIADAMDYPDRQVAYHALRGVLFTLRDRLVLEEAVHLAMQLPMLIRGVYFEGYQPGSKPETYDREEFTQRVAHELEQAGGADPEAAIRGVFGVLERHISEGETQQVVDMLPNDLKVLWPK
jgi:uncharacterized protein (DUF2267 family)